MHIGSAFFRTAPFLDIGLRTHDWEFHCGEYEVWMRFGDKYRIDYVPGINVKFAQGWEGQLSNSGGFPVNTGKAMGRIMHRFYKESRLLQGDEALRSFCASGVLRTMSAFPSATPEKMEELLVYFRNELGVGMEVRTSFDLCQKLCRAGNSNLAMSLCKQLIQEGGANWPAYHLLASLLAERGEVPQALIFWEKPCVPAMPPNMPAPSRPDSSLPGSMPPQLLDKQQAWAATLSVPALPPPVCEVRDDSRLRLGLHAADWQSEEARRQIVPVLRELDRSRFEVICYGGGPLPVVPEVKGFSSENLSDADFAALTRSHHLDCLIELSGLDPGHRYGALAARCAPTQIAYLNHFGTTACRISIISGRHRHLSRGEETFTSETVYRLPGCLTCFDLSNSTGANEPPWSRMGTSLSVASRKGHRSIRRS